LVAVFTLLGLRIALALAAVLQLAVLLHQLARLQGAGSHIIGYVVQVGKEVAEVGIPAWRVDIDEAKLCICCGSAVGSTPGPSRGIRSPVALRLPARAIDSVLRPRPSIDDRRRCSSVRGGTKLSEQ
jgi:hypothetical protein